MSTKLNPTLTTKTKAKAVAEQEGRKRPVVAINEEGKLVVCCRRTAKKNGWEVQDVLYERAKVKASAAPEPVNPAVKTRRATDSTAVKTKVKKAKEVVDAALDDILGK